MGNGCSVVKSFRLHLRSLDSSPDLRQRSLFNDDDLEEVIECATQDATIKELTNEVSCELLPGYPIMCDKYNLCEMTSGGKLDTTKCYVHE